MASITVDDIDRGIALSFGSRIPWDDYVGPKGKSTEGIFLDSADVKLIKKFSTENAVAMAELLATDAEARQYPSALLKVLMNVLDVRVISYTLTLLEDFLVADPANRARLFTKPGSTDGRIFVLPFLQMIGTTGTNSRIVSTDANPYVLERASHCAAHLLAVDPSDAAAVSAMMAWVVTNIRQYGSLVTRQVKVTEVSAECLMVLLRNDFLRTLFVEEKGIERLTPILSARNTQLLYNGLFCLWLLSLQKPLCPLLERTGAVVAVSRCVRAGQPTKVLRVSLALLTNCAKHPECEDTIAEVCETHVPEVVDLLLHSEPPVSDPELAEDLRWLSDAITRNRRVLSSVERYRKELTARRFEWNSVHSPEFWKEHALEFEAGEFAAIKEVGAMLSDAAGLDEVTVAVALHDLGEFAVNHPQGRTVLASLGLRPVVMSFLKRDEDDVKQQALLAVSKLMVQHWQYVSGNAAEAATPKK